MLLGQDMREAFLQTHGFVPVFFTKAIPVMATEAPIMLLSPITYIFLHGGLFHLISNMWAMWIYGDNVEDRMGHFRFLVFFIICGVAAAGTHYVFHSGEIQPVVGASGALAGVMAAYMRLFPMAEDSMRYLDHIHRSDCGSPRVDGDRYLVYQSIDECVYIHAGSRFE